MFFRRLDSCLLLEDGGGDSIHVGDTFLGERLAHHDGFAFFGFKLDLTDNTGFLEFNEAVSDVLLTSNAGSLSAGSSSCFTTVVLAESFNTNLSSDVHLVSDGSSASKEPVIILWGEFLVRSSFAVLGPLIIQKIILNTKI